MNPFGTIHIFKGNSLLRNCLIIIIATIGMLPELCSSGGYIISGDITHQILPFIYETKKLLSSGAPLWSWNTYLGDNFYAGYSYYTLFNPFAWLNCLFPYRYLALGFTLIMYLKFLLCGYLANKFFKCLGFDDRLSLIGSLLYTFSSWAICNLIFYFFYEPMLLLPLLLIAVERFLQGRSHPYSTLIGGTFVVVIVNYYFAPINLLLATLYYFCRLGAAEGKASSKAWLTAKAAGCVITGILGASVVLVPVLLYLYGSQQQTLDLESGDVFLILDRLFWLVYPKTHEGPSYYIFLHSGWKSNSASIAVFGLLPAILIFTRKGLKWLKWMISILIVIYATPLNGIFSLFTDCYYTRWAYGLSLALVLPVLYYLKNYGVPRLKFAVIYCIIVYGAYMLIYGASVAWLLKEHVPLSDPSIAKISADAFLVVLNAAALILVCRRREADRRWSITTIAAITVCCAAQFFVYSSKSLPKKTSDGDFILTETEYFVRGLHQRENQQLNYRTNFTVLNTGSRPSSNFGLITNQPSIETYHSLQNTRLGRWNEAVGDSSKRVFNPCSHVASFEALTSVKQLVVVSAAPIDTLHTQRYLGNEGLFYSFESDHYIPMGFAYDTYVLRSEIDSIIDNTTADEADVPKLLLGSIAIADEDEAEISGFLTKAHPDRDAALDSLVRARRAAVCNEFIPSSRGFRAHINLADERLVMFSVLADPGFKATIDGVPTKIFDANLGFSALAVPEGSHEIAFEYTPPGLYAGMWISIFCLLVLIAVFIVEERSSRHR